MKIFDKDSYFYYYFVMENKKNNFKRISQNRLEKIISTIEQLENLTNSSFYEYTDEEIKEIFNQIYSVSKKTEQKLIDNNKKKKKVRI